MIRCRYSNPSSFVSVEQQKYVGLVFCNQSVLHQNVTLTEERVFFHKRIELSMLRAMSNTLDFILVELFKIECRLLLNHNKTAEAMTKMMMNKTY